MTVGELIDLLEQYPKDVEVLVDCRNLDDCVIYEDKHFYVNSKDSVVHIDI